MNIKPEVKEVLEWVYCIIIAIVLALLFRYYVGTPTIVKQESMKPTLIQNQRLWLNRWGRTIGKMPERGDIITFEAPSKKSYTASEIENALHHEELPPARRTVLCVYGAVRGVGGIDSWGSDVEDSYHISGEENITYSFVIA